MAPEHKIPLGMAKTPIEPWFIPGIPADVTVHIKRDDMTGGPLSGNKVRKLEYLLADALLSDADSLITCGGVQSNHARATCIAGRQLGLESHLVLRSTSQEMTGNLLMNCLAGASTYLVPREPYLTGLLPRMQLVQRELTRAGKTPYLIPVGGSNLMGFWGYLDAFDELLEQGLGEQFDDLVLATGSGGTAAALSVANMLCGSPVKIHAIAVSDNSEYFYQHVDATLAELGIGHHTAQDLLTVVDGHKGRGYGLSTPAELESIASVSAATGILLDPVYTGKAYMGLRGLLAKGDRLRGTRVLFLHTGGTFGCFDGAKFGWLRDDSSLVHNCEVSMQI
jgi:D-cysteine desulfhydrase family pyridoxal phosphate-dependent enzyme